MSLLHSQLASVYLVLDWHRSRREEMKNPLSRYLFVVTFAPDLSQLQSSVKVEYPIRLKRSHLDGKAVERVLDIRSRYTDISSDHCLYEFYGRDKNSHNLETREHLRSINAECRTDSSGMHSIASYQINIDKVGGAAGKARAFDRRA
ncbi:hypothetical protein ALC62_03587 [Cyphomyrmex costatus]|uniref:Uncharacterized protein n=1 Tax=Cyphomyrmex costatus TaxID=456900 RepID=A0A151IL73_9HYME|nr:hypothetical protein ALC62_03587 [Cyphomyrmex costatus]